MSSIKRIGVVGAGLMGAGIAEVSVLAGFEVTLVDADFKTAIASRGRILDRLQSFVERERIDRTQLDEAESRLQVAADLTDLVGSDVVIEAVVEDVSVKQDLFTTLSSFCGAETLLVTNTSALSISSIAAHAQNPGRIVGMHFFHQCLQRNSVKLFVGFIPKTSQLHWLEN